MSGGGGPAPLVDALHQCVQAHDSPSDGGGRQVNAVLGGVPAGVPAPPVCRSLSKPCSLENRSTKKADWSGVTAHWVTRSPAPPDLYSSTCACQVTGPP